MIPTLRFYQSYAIGEGEFSVPQAAPKNSLSKNLTPCPFPKREGVPSSREKSPPSRFGKGDGGFGSKDPLIIKETNPRNKQEISRVG